MARMRGHAFLTESDLLDVAIDILQGRLDLTDDRTD